MKLVTILFAIMTILPTAAFAAFDLQTIKSIHCDDSNPSADINMVFSTDDAAAQKYTRRPDTIPFDYGNKAMTYFPAESGQMHLNNNPETDHGVIALLEDPDYPGEDGNSLLLTPTTQPGVYDGALGGIVEIRGDWSPLKNHPMHCLVTKNP